MRQPSSPNKLAHPDNSWTIPLLTHFSIHSPARMPKTGGSSRHPLPALDGASHMHWEKSSPSVADTGTSVHLSRSSLVTYFSSRSKKAGMQRKVLNSLYFLQRLTWYLIYSLVAKMPSMKHTSSKFSIIFVVTTSVMVGLFIFLKIAPAPI